MWDLELNDRELSILAEAQASLKPKAPIITQKKLETKEPELVELPKGPDVSNLRLHVERAAHLLNGIRQLMAVLDELRMAHQRVSTKSVVLQSTWEGALSASGQIGAKKKEIARRLACFSNLNEAITTIGKASRMPVDGNIPAGLIEAIFVANDNMGILQTDYFESAQYLVRLKQVLNYAILFLKDTLKLRLGRFELAKAMEPFGQVWRTFNAFAELEKPLAEAADIFISARFTQFNAQIKRFAMESAAKPDHLDLLLTEYANRLQDELIIFEREFGSQQPNIESLAIPLLRYVRSVIDNSPQKAIAFNPAGFNPLVVEQMDRIVQIIKEYQLSE